MWPDRVSNPGPLTYESGALPTALRGPALYCHSISLLLVYNRKAIIIKTEFLPKTVNKRFSDIKTRNTILQN